MSVTPVGDLDALRRQIAATQARFAAIGARLASAAETITTTGTLPPDGLLREVQDAAHEFSAVRGAVLDAAAALEVLLPPVPPREVFSLRDLGPLMDAVERAAREAARRRRLDAARAAAFAVLNRVPAIAHSEDSVFAPLASCQSKARTLRAAIALAEPADVEEEARAWLRAVAPFAALLELLSGPAADDTRWSELEELVGAVFGRRLATAAVRGKLVIR
jgi:hypothetical protein